MLLYRRNKVPSQTSAVFFKKISGTQRVTQNSVGETCVSYTTTRKKVLERHSGSRPSEKTSETSLRCISSQKYFSVRPVFFCEISASLDGEYNGDSFLGYNAVKYRWNRPTFQRCVRTVNDVKGAISQKVSS
jgi:hypothetical protein